jgi:flagellar hook assembly protein FlgD
LPTATGVAGGSRPGPILLENYPNPFNPSTTISFVIREKGAVTLSIHDVNGKLVNTLIDGTLEKGYRRIAWAGTDSQGLSVASGVYFCRLQAGTATSVKKMVLLK